MFKTNAVPRQRRPRRTGAGRTPVRAACLVLLAALGSCATPPRDPEALAELKALNDPLEPTNRALFAVNNVIEAAVVRPVAKAYQAVLPEAVRDGVHNVLSNLGAPVRLAN